MGIMLYLCVYVCVHCFFWEISAFTDSITLSRPLSNGTTLVSNDGTFELGFFQPGAFKNQYLGIWYRRIQVKTVVWVANRERPIEDPPGTLMINRTGHLVILNRNGSLVWSSSLTKEAINPVAQLLDTGNLVLRDQNYGYLLWQSFDYPSDTLLPGMKLGWDFRIGLERRVTSWKSPDDPSSGTLVWNIVSHSYPEAIIWKGSKEYFRNGPWNGIRFTGNPQLGPNPVFRYEFVSNKEEMYYLYELKNTSVLSRVVMNQTSSTRQRYVWMEVDQYWKLYAELPQDLCDMYSLCGANGICISSDSPICNCLDGFKPKLLDKWNAMDWSHGCILEKPLNCQSTHDGFVKFSYLKLPDTTHTYWNRSMSLNECRNKCFKDCSCTAYTNSNITGSGSGCAIWYGGLVDIRQIQGEGQDLYIRMPVSLVEEKHGFKLRVIIIIVAAIAAVALILTGAYNFFKIKSNSTDEFEGVETERECREEDLDVPSFDLVVLAVATDNFSIRNKLGEGGFGPVYKGTLPVGQEIAVKRLSQSSRQGLNEFKNEVALIAKLQHRNLVKLLGYCVQGEEKLLVYEFMPNGSLGSFIFGSTCSMLLDWSKRFHIICGIARGLLYLHQDSRLRIIHRDLKASNVLLDKELNPKISDFGLARAFGEQSHEESTERVVGTYGYMAPEYAIYGIFSVKSDVFSFGIILLEIVTGKKNFGVHHPSSSNLIGHAWSLWTEGRSEELIDPVIRDSNLSEALRCIQVGLLCVQSHPEDRPDMLTVVLMLNGESALPTPKQPGFLMEIKTHELFANSSSSKPELSSRIDISHSLVEGR